MPTVQGNVQGNPELSRHGSAQLLAVRGAGLWLLAGAIAKSLAGTPGGLPAPILALDVNPIAVIVAAIVVEVTVAALALLVPRLGWCLAAALLVGFVIVLTLHLSSGAEHCGCFGGELPVPAWLVLSIDAALVLALVVTAYRSELWRFRAIRARWVAFGLFAGIACGAALGKLADRRLESMRPAESLPAARSATTAEPAIDPHLGGASTRTWKLPDEFPDQVLLRPSQWIGKPIESTELGRWCDTSKFPRDATIIIYYLSCNHCGDHLRAFAHEQAANPAIAPTYVLAQLPTPSAYTGKLFVDSLPVHAAHVELPAQVKAWVITPPWDVIVKDGIVTNADRIRWSGEAKQAP